MTGWQRWRDGHPTESRMGLVVERFIPPQRRELGDDDLSCWEVDSDGSARDPWQFANCVVAMPPEFSRPLYLHDRFAGRHQRCRRSLQGSRPRHPPSTRLLPARVPRERQLSAQGQGTRPHQDPVFRLVRYVDARPFDFCACRRAWGASRVAGTADGLIDRRTHRVIGLAKPGLAKAGIVDDDLPF